MTEAAPNLRTTPEVIEDRSVLFSVLVGLASLAVLLQGVWAGIFLEHDGSRDAASTWIDIHAAGGYAAIVLAVAATAVAVLRLRARRDLIVGTGVFAVLLIVETGMGAAIHDGTDVLTAVHVPLAMAIMAVAVWLPLRTRNRA
jgi:hypothetical protein